MISVGYVYILRKGDAFKVGRTGNPAKRQKEHRVKFEAIAAVPDMWVAEGELIRTAIEMDARRYWHGDEWFYYDKTIYNHLVDMVESWDESDVLGIKKFRVSVPDEIIIEFNDEPNSAYL